MKITYDRSIDAAYILLGDEIGIGGVAKTYSCDPSEINGEINLDFDLAGQLVGIEVQDASKRLPLNFLSAVSSPRNA